MKIMIEELLQVERTNRGKIKSLYNMEVEGCFGAEIESAKWLGQEKKEIIEAMERILE